MSRPEPIWNGVRWWVLYRGIPVPSNCEVATRWRITRPLEAFVDRTRLVFPAVPELGCVVLTEFQVEPKRRRRDRRPLFFKSAVEFDAGLGPPADPRRPGWGSAIASRIGPRFAETMLDAKTAHWRLVEELEARGLKVAPLVLPDARVWGA